MRLSVSFGFRIKGWIAVRNSDCLARSTWSFNNSFKLASPLKPRSKESSSRLRNPFE